MAFDFYEHETTTCIVLQLLQWHLVFAAGHLAVYRDYTYLMLTLSRSQNNCTELPSFSPAYLFCILISNTIVFKLLGSWIIFCWVTLSTVYKCLFKLHHCNWGLINVHRTKSYGEYFFFWFPVINQNTYFLQRNRRIIKNRSYDFFY